MSEPVILEEDSGVIVVYDGSLVHKTVRGVNSTGFFQKVDPEIIVRREVFALEQLHGVSGIQQLVRQDSPVSFYSEYIPGSSLKQFGTSVPEEYFSRLEELTLFCREKGIYRVGESRTDFLVTPEGEPAIIDFGNVIFETDPVMRVPGFKRLLERYAHVRMQQIKKKHLRSPTLVPVQ